MAEFEVMPGKLREQAGNLNDISRMLQTYGQGISSVSLGLSGIMGGSYAIIFETLQSIMGQLRQDRQSTDSMQTVLMRAAERYLNTETKIVDAAGKKETIQHPDNSISWNASSGVWNTSAGADGSLNPLTGRWTGNADADASASAFPVHLPVKGFRLPSAPADVFHTPEEAFHEIELSGC